MIANELSRLPGYTHKKNKTKEHHGSKQKVKGGED